MHITTPNNIKQNFLAASRIILSVTSIACLFYSSISAFNSNNKFISFLFCTATILGLASFTTDEICRKITERTIQNKTIFQKQFSSKPII